jgi:hypothetical protein
LGSTGDQPNRREKMDHSFDNHYEAYAFMVAHNGVMWPDELAGQWIVRIP